MILNFVKNPHEYGPITRTLKSKNVFLAESSATKIVWRVVLDQNLTRPNFLVGVMHVNRDPWLSIVKQGQELIWTRDPYKNFKVFYFYSVSTSLSTSIDRIVETLRWRKGRYASYFISYFLMFSLSPFREFLPKARISNPERSGVMASSLRVLIPEMTCTMRWKKLAFLQHFLKESDADYVIITNSSSALNFQPISDFVRLRCIPNKPLYAGPIHMGYDGAFVSGSFTLMNREAAELLLQNRRLIPSHVMDDIGFGNAFNKLGVMPVEFESLVIDSERSLSCYTRKELSRYGHYRLKSQGVDSRNDAQIALRLIEKLGH